jgi:hypothetical protein
MGKKKSTSTKSKSPAKREVKRDVGAQSKGPRLQRLRAVLLLIKSAEHYPQKNVFTAVEFQGDVFVTTADRSETVEYHEEDKNYALTTTFTLNSREVLNALVSFVDCWISKNMSPSVSFGFYTPNKYSKEKSTNRNKSDGLEWPEQPVLELLTLFNCGKSENRIASTTVELVKQATIAEYDAQAKKHEADSSDATVSSRPLHNLQTIAQWKPLDWTAFLSQIEWKFGEDDCDSINKEIVDAIQSSPLYNEQLAGKEGLIINALVDLIDKRQEIKDPCQRFVHVAEVLLAFQQVQSGTVKLPDPAWKLWETLTPTDSRSLPEKVAAVCDGVSERELNSWTRRAAQSLIEQQVFNDQKSVLALKYQIFTACDEKLINLLPDESTTQFNPAEITSIVNELVAIAQAKFEDCQSQYQYPIKSKDSIQSIVFELFQSCFLNFERSV